jgi:integrase
VKLTKTSVANLVVPRGKIEHVVFDDDIPGFGVRLREGGSRTWIFQYRQGGKQRRLSFGSVSALRLSEARAEASKLHAKVRLGTDPAGAKIEARAKAAETVGAIIKRYVEGLEAGSILSKKRRGPMRPSTLGDTRRYLTQHAKPLHGLSLAKVDRRAVAARLGEVAQTSGATAANRMRSALSTFFVWCMGEGLIDTNPVIGTNKVAESGERERVLSDDELRAIWAALGDDQYSTIVRLLALTGQRRDEIGALAWSEVDTEKATITLPPARTKNKLEHTVPLSATALELIERLSKQPRTDRELVFGYRAGPFSGYSKAKAALDARIAEANDDGKPLRDWRLHDLRRTMSTIMNGSRLKIAPHIVEAILNHTVGGVAGVYNKAKAAGEYDHDMRVALDRWAEHLTAIVEERADKVVSPPVRAA